LAEACNVSRDDLPRSLGVAPESPLLGKDQFRGIPFDLGTSKTRNVILLDDEEVHLETAEFKASYVVFLHAVEDRKTKYLDGFADKDKDGNELGTPVAEYGFKYADGSSVTSRILRRFSIQQSRISWGASPFAAVPAKNDNVFSTVTENNIGDKMTQRIYGRGETRVDSARDAHSEHLWLYALPNPNPELVIQSIILKPGDERVVIYGISHTNVETHPLRPGTREKLLLTLPEGVVTNTHGELEGIDIDLGTVISARRALDYDRARWLESEPDVQPAPSLDQVVIEFAAHPKACLYLITEVGELIKYQLADLCTNTYVRLNPATRPVRIRVVEKGSSQPVAVRLHLHGQAGEYLPPRGYHRKVNPHWFEDNYGEFVNGHNQYCYIPGECEVELPLGEVFIHISRGYEIAPFRDVVKILPKTTELNFELNRVLDWRDRGWVSADTHVHFLKPQTALLEGQAEGVNVVNLLASQWGEMFSNVSDFDGRTTIGAKEFGGDGEFLVRVGTENRMQVLGHVSLLGYKGPMIHPLCTGGPSESAIGDPLETTLAEWARRCIAQGGLVVMPHAPNPQCERAADIVLGLIDAVEMMTFNPQEAQINPYGIADWYRYLNLGYQIPVVGGSDKMAASTQLGGIRTYANLGGKPFTYEHWMEAVRSGNTFVTVGPLIELSVEGQAPGSKLKIPGSGGPITIEWRVESVSLPIEMVELVVGGLTVEEINVGKQLSTAGTTELEITESTWIALRVRGSYRGANEEIAAHSSAVQVLVSDKPLFSPKDATTVIEQIEGAIAYVDTLAPRADVERYKRIRATLESAHNRLHQRMHQQGVFHRHVPLHDHESPREH
jgi:hypothetical protein